MSIRNLRVPISTMMMLVVAAAAGSALFAGARSHTVSAALKTDAPMLLLLAIGLTAVALGSWKSHTVVQILLQGTLACLGCLTLIWASEAGMERTVRYWFQAMFAATVVAPLIARRYVKETMPRGPGRDWWKKTCEAVFFSGLGLLLVFVGGMLQAIVTMIGYEYLKR